MKWKKAPGRKKKVDPMIKVPVIYVCDRCHGKSVDSMGDTCFRCTQKIKARKERTKRLDEEYSRAFRKHKLKS